MRASIVGKNGKLEVKKLNLYEMYEFGKNLAPLSKITSEAKVTDHLFYLWFARESLNKWLGVDSPLLNTARRAARKMADAITDVVPVDITKAMEIDKDQEIGWRANGITQNITELESVLGNDMPDIAAYVVSQKGIYRTDDLIAHAEYQLSGEVRNALPGQACFDLQQAGKCLAYELATACAFHLWRAVETVMGDYYLQLAGKSFDDANVTRNWAKYIEALKKEKADLKITTFLDHIRDEYRNPQTHPDASIDIDEALRLFSVAISSIDQMMRTILLLRKKVNAFSAVSSTVMGGLP